MSTLVDPFNITDFNRTDAELESFFLFCTAVAGKKASMISLKLRDFLDGYPGESSPFNKIREMIAENSLENNLCRVSMGKYGLLFRSWTDLASRPEGFLRQATVEQLETVPGIGPKSARFFLVHSRKSAMYAVIDTHMLKFLRDSGYSGVPAGNSPSGKVYPVLEKIVLSHAVSLGMTPADFDLSVWKWYAAGNKGVPEFIGINKTA